MDDEEMTAVNPKKSKPTSEFEADIRKRRGVKAEKKSRNDVERWDDFRCEENKNLRKLKRFRVGTYSRVPF